MTNLQLQELNFTLLTKDFNPAILDLNTLQNKGIIQADWQLAENPIYSNSGIKYVFTNRVRIIAQSNSIIFAETIGRKRIQDIHLPKIVSKHFQAFDQIDYQVCSLKPSGYAPFNSNSESCQYMSSGLLASNSWQKFQEREISAVGLKLAYPYKTGNFYLDINQASVEVSGIETPAVWFAGNFIYQLLDGDSTKKKAKLESIFEDWQTDIKIFQDFINNEFLAVSIMPSLSLFPL